jgi:hypothetical protein
MRSLDRRTSATIIGKQYQVVGEEGRMFLFIGLVVLGVGLFVYGVYFLFFKKNLGSDD